MSTTSQTSGFPLAMASEDTAVRIISLQGGASLTKRLTEMGLNVGSEIWVRQRQGAGGLVISRGETRFALGFGMASKILVCPV
ncbi:ferrous iron transport protein A [Azomonas agilis]|uniref:Ferrous iron transport protein A n=1 Tax=Azomonas agilis TaxID=116849 RepID=A0A562HYV5_9GAMM|nr:FeoA family protein [Azomonas agilis]TWH63967.1 ferrous iron transport protein A [Azomonas agilis]